MVEVQRLAVEIARRFANFEEFLNFRVRNIKVAGSRTTAQRALRNGKRERIHDANEGNNPRRLAVQAHRLANAAH